MSLLWVALGRAQSADGEGTAETDADVPTWYADVQPVVTENCVQCHQPQGANMGGMVAPFSMTSYEEARPYAPMMAVMVEEERMPPWDAHPVHKGEFKGEMYLTEAEKRTIIEWGRNGAPEGDPANAQAEASFTAEKKLAEKAGESWLIGEPDMVLEFGEPYRVPDDVLDMNVDVNLQVPGTHTEPRWFKASEIRGGSQYVHHACGEPFSCIAPGWDPYVYPEGYAKILPAVDAIELGMHYNKPANVGEITDVSKVGIVFYEEGDTIRHFVRKEGLSVGQDFVIPAGNPNYSVSGEFEFEEDTYILSLTPHMHLRGKSAKYELEYPDGRRELLLWVPEYDFHWQRVYAFEDPPVAPAGSKVIFTPTWDNSKHNSSSALFDETRNVPYGGPTIYEMGIGHMNYTRVEPIEIVVGEDPVPEELAAPVRKRLAEDAADNVDGPTVDGDTDGVLKPDQDVKALDRTLVEERKASGTEQDEDEE